MSKDSQQSEEVDLGQLFKLIGNMFERLFKFIGSIFNRLFLSFVWLVFFVKKHFLKLVIAGIAGIALGFAIQKTSAPTYKSYILVKQNYDTGSSLYNAIAYYDDLVEQKDINTLSSVLGIDSTTAASISYFEIESVISDNDKLKNYDNYIKGLDSVLASTFEYSTYIENEENYNNKYQQITIKAKERNNFNKVFAKITENINTNPYFVREQQKDTLELFNTKEALRLALIKSDSLKNTYKKVLENSMKTPKGSEIGITFEGANDKNKTKEYELFQNDIQLQREIVEIERQIKDKEQILEVISSKHDTGTIDNKKEVLGIKIGYKLYYGLLLSMMAFITLLGIEFVKYLEKFKSKI